MLHSTLDQVNMPVEQIALRTDEGSTLSFNIIEEEV
jgi:hypothetical protein